MTASSNPFGVGSWGWGMLVHQNHATEEDNGSIMVGMFVSLCLASKKSSEREFFVPAGTHLGVKLLMAQARSSRMDNFATPQRSKKGTDTIILSSNQSKAFLFDDSKNSE